METAHLPEHWRDLYVMLGTSSAALIGLLFVATSLHLDDIVNNPVFRIRARNLTIHLIVTLVQAAAVLTPQPIAVLGAELVAVSLCGLWFPLSFTFQAYIKSKSTGKSGDFSIYRAIVYVISYVLAIAGGAMLVKQAGQGMYLVTVAYVTALISAVWNAWMIMLGVGQMEKAAK
jgi:hypothetical protein